MNIGCRIIKDFTRPPKELVRQFYDLATSDLDDTMSRFGAVDHSITPLKKYTRSVVERPLPSVCPMGTTCFSRRNPVYETGRCCCHRCWWVRRPRRGRRSDGQILQSSRRQGPYHRWGNP